MVDISVTTVKKHRNRIYERFGAEGARTLYAVAMQGSTTMKDGKTPKELHDPETWSK